MRPRRRGWRPACPAWRTSRKRRSPPRPVPCATWRRARSSGSRTRRPCSSTAGASARSTARSWKPLRTGCRRLRFNTEKEARMRRLSFSLAALLLAASPLLAAAAQLAYPPAPRGTVTDTFFGTPVADPYRWMEDVDAPQTTAWVKAEGDLTRSYLDAIPQRNAIRTAYRALIDYEKVGAPFHQGQWWF